jgi:hypothetical protein
MKDDKDYLAKLDALAKQLAVGDEDLADLLPQDATMSQKLTQARNMSEQALAKKVLDNTGVPIPGKGRTRGQVEDFFQRILAETHPEISPKVRVLDNPTVGKDIVSGYYSPLKDEVVVGSQVVKRSPTKAVATLLHEGAHGYDKKVKGFNGVNDFDAMSIKDKLKIRPDESAFDLYELGAKNHHAKIKGLREGTFGFGGLKSYLKNNGKFRAIGPVAAIGGALAAGSASDALADTVVPGGVESLGEGSDQVLTPEQQQSVEASRQLTEGQPMNQQRFQALQRMLKR